MATLRSNGTELFRVTSGRKLLSVRSNGKILKRYSFRSGWTVQGSVTPGLTTRGLALDLVKDGEWKLVDVELPELNDERIIVSVKDAERRAKNRAKRKAAKPKFKYLHRNDVRFRLEQEADPGSALRRVISWNALAFACARKVQCPECDVILSAAEAVLCTNGDTAVRGEARSCVLCTDCFDKKLKGREIDEVIDGRELDCPSLRQAVAFLS